MKKFEIENKLKSSNVYTPEINILNIASRAVMPTKPKKSKLWWTKYKGAMVAAIIILMVVVGATSGISVYNNTPQTELYIDVNPSIKLMVTPTNKVTDIVALNDDAEGLFDLGKAEDNSLESVSEYIIDILSVNGYMSDGNELYISTTGNNQDKAAKVMNTFQEKFNNKNETANINMPIHRMENCQKREEYQKISPAKMQLINQILAEEDNTYTEDELETMSMSNLRILLNHDPISPNSPDNNQPNGNQEPNGQQQPNGQQEPKGQQSDGQTESDGQQQTNGQQSNNGNGQGAK
ncbi:MAG: hypothetical protein WCR54_07525 [Clostridia bacterium]